ncbi:MAG: ATP-binding cassette domain-containing protein, partial [Tepidimonas fonticaldi]|nr:ATP-binding cassette domain-containing protein [Tepidimonas fonticaldi]
MAEALLQIDGLTKRYGGRAVVEDLSFSIEPGECVGLLGPNGAGKTTTLRMALGQVAPDAGSVRVFGLPMP